MRASSSTSSYVTMRNLGVTAWMVTSFSRCSGVTSGDRPITTSVRGIRRDPIQPQLTLDALSVRHAFRGRKGFGEGRTTGGHDALLGEMLSKPARGLVERPQAEDLMPSESPVVQRDLATRRVQHGPAEGVEDPLGLRP